MSDPLIHALVFGPSPEPTQLEREQIRTWRPEQGLLWVHIDSSTTDAGDLLDELQNVPKVVRSALLAEETRPRSTAVGDGLLLILPFGKDWGKWGTIILMAVCSSIVITVLWFVAVQVFILGQICPFCMTSHVFGCIAAILYGIEIQKQSGLPFPKIAVILGAVATIVFVVLQWILPQPDHCQQQLVPIVQLKGVTGSRCSEAIRTGKSLPLRDLVTRRHFDHHLVKLANRQTRHASEYRRVLTQVLVAHKHCLSPRRMISARDQCRQPYHTAARLGGQVSSL